MTKKRRGALPVNRRSLLGGHQGKTILISHLLSTLESLPDLVGDLLTGFVSISQTHIGVFIVEHGIRDVSVSCLHGSLEEHGLLALPHLQYWHAVDRAALHILGGLVGDVVGTHNQADINVLHVIVNLIHLKHPVIRHRGLSQQHIHLPGHSSGDGVDSESHVDTVLSAGVGDGGDLGLSTSDSHTVPGDDHHFLGIGQHLCDLLGLDFSVHFRRCVGILLHGGNSVHAAENHVEDVSIHSLAHDESENGSAEPDEGSHNGEHGVVQHEPLGHQGPATVGVQYSDAHGHVASAHRCHQMNAHPARQQGGGPLHLGRHLGAVSRQEQIDEPEERAQTHQVDEVLARQIPCRGGHAAIQLQKGNNGTGESHTTNKVSRNSEDVLDAGADLGVLHKLSNGGEHGSQSDEGVEQSDGLRETDGADGATEQQTQNRPDAHQDQRSSDTGFVHAQEGHFHGGSDTGHTKDGSHVGCLHRGQPTDSGDAQQTTQSLDGLTVRCIGDRERDEQHSSQQEKLGVILVTLPLEEVQQPQRHNESTKDVDKRHQSSGHRQVLSHVGFDLIEKQQAANSS
mmetsp:Transcript_57662/g.133084  ORF Transcript_57662/g.133084 Transcript_57662/m.133084 type:complete len:568 (+) Transcript_57662:61-1764(+)